MSLGVALVTSSAKAQLTPAQQAGLDLRSASNFAFIDLGATTLGWNSGPIDGDVLLGMGVHANLSGGNNGGLTAGHVVKYDSTAAISGHLQNQPTMVAVANSVTQQAATDATNVSLYASSLAATQTFGTISGTSTINGNGGLNVIDATNIQNDTLTLNGTANDYFVFNISGLVNTNRSMTLTGGLTADHILFNLTGSGTVLFQTSGGDVLYGTFLAVNGGKYQFSNLDLTGRLINIGGDVQFVSGSQIPVGVPEPSVIGLMIAGAAALARFGRIRSAGSRR